MRLRNNFCTWLWGICLFAVLKTQKRLFAALEENLSQTMKSGASPVAYFKNLTNLQLY